MMQTHSLFISKSTPIFGNVFGRFILPRAFSHSGYLYQQRSKADLDQPQPYESVLQDALHLPEEQRTKVLKKLQEDYAKSLIDEYQNRLGKLSWRSRFGRPSKMTTLASDPTGQFCEIPTSYIEAKLAAKVPKPTPAELWEIAVFNAVPFIGFGFLDNLVMIIAGDYIDLTLGHTLGISTMAAAALGNTVSDVAGIGSAWYVENVAAKVGVKPPRCTPVQLEMASARYSANLGRAVGVVLGCILGMLPLLFINTKENAQTPAENPVASKSSVNSSSANSAATLALNSPLPASEANSTMSSESGSNDGSRIRSTPNQVSSPSATSSAPSNSSPSTPGAETKSPSVS